MTNWDTSKCAMHTANELWCIWLREICIEFVWFSKGVTDFGPGSGKSGIRPFFGKFGSGHICYKIWAYLKFQQNCSSARGLVYISSKSLSLASAPPSAGFGDANPAKSGTSLSDSRYIHTNILTTTDGLSLWCGKDCRQSSPSSGHKSCPGNYHARTSRQLAHTLIVWVNSEPGRRRLWQFCLIDARCTLDCSDSVYQQFNDLPTSHASFRSSFLWIARQQCISL